jgi:hypothetical protein
MSNQSMGNTIWPAGDKNRPLTFTSKDTNAYAKANRAAKNAAAYASITPIWNPSGLNIKAKEFVPSRLNTKAKEFVPSGLNPNANEFVPSGGYKKRAKKTRRRKNLKRTRRV